jgi:hypothetical protein
MGARGMALIWGISYLNMRAPACQADHNWLGGLKSC